MKIKKRYWKKILSDPHFAVTRLTHAAAIYQISSVRIGCAYDAWSRNGVQVKHKRTSGRIY